MRISLFIAIGSIASAAHVSAADAQSQTAPPSDSETVVLRAGTQPPGIVVQGERPIEEKEVRDAVRDIAMRGRSFDRPLTRFQAPLCLQVAGLGESLNETVAGRIRANTLSAGFVLGEDDCDTNALVIVVKNPARLIERLREEQPRIFTVKTSRTIKAAQRRGDVAIGWSVSNLAGPRGRPLPENGTFAGAGITGAATVSENAGQGVPTTSSSGVSRFKIPFSSERVYSVLVFDVERMTGVHLDQLADYATMRILATPQPQVDLESDTTADSILTLFDQGPYKAPQQMTQIDRAYLRALYTLRPNDPSTRLENFVLAAYEEIREEDCSTRGGRGCTDRLP